MGSTHLLIYLIGTVGPWLTQGGGGGGGCGGGGGGSLVFLIWACYVIRVSRLAEVHTMPLVQLHAPLQFINSVQIIVSTM